MRTFTSAESPASDPNAAQLTAQPFNREYRALIRAVTPISRPLAHPVGRPPGRDMPWRTPAGKSQPGYFSEAEAQRRTLAPRLPHHRHPMTADEALAGIVLLIALAACAFYVGWWLA